MRRIGIHSILLLLGAFSARADLLVLENGDTLSGSALRVVEGALVFRTSLEGQMMAPMDTVRTLSTDDNFAFGFADGSTRYGKLDQQEGGLYLLPMDGGDPAPVVLGEIVEAEKIPQTARRTPDDAGMAVTLESGLQARSGTTEALEPFARLGLSGTQESRSTEASILVEAADADFFPAYLEAEAAWRFRNGEALQPFVAATAERDTDNALDLRTGLTLGLGRVLRQRGPGTLSGTAGFNVAYEVWDGRGLARQGGPARLRDEDATHSEVNLRLGLRYARSLFGTGTFANELQITPALTDAGDFRADNATELSYPLSDRLRLRLDLHVGYDNSPGFDGLDEWRSAVGAGVRVDF